MPLVFEHKLLELDDDGLLAGVGFGGLAVDGIGIGGGAGLLEEGDNLFHVLFCEMPEDAANGAQHLHVFAADAITVEFGDNAFELFADALGGGLDLLLFEFLLEKGVGAGGFRRGGGREAKADKNAQQAGETKFHKAAHGREPRCISGATLRIGLRRDSTRRRGYSNENWGGR